MAMKVYTRTGDDGTTGLIGGGRVRKCDARLDCSGTVDELNATLGWAAVACDAPVLGQLRRMLGELQNDLFVIGSHLATPHDGPHKASLPPLDEGIVTRLKMQIDAAE